MPLQNRVDPWGQLHAVKARGAWLGNRGIIHNDKKEIVAPWRGQSWVTCALSFEGIQRTIFSPGAYSELFFLDEATAFSAGHRPCADCRRERFKEFKAAWVKANPNLVKSPSPTIAEVDKVLHSERAARGEGKVTFESKFKDIPSGVFIDIESKAWLNWEGRLHEWSFTGYVSNQPAPPPSTEVRVLTPASIVRVLSAGFVPQTHASVRT